MAHFFSMPKLGMNMTEGVVVSWLVREGDRIEAGQPLVEVETDKAVNTIEAPESGVLARIIRDEGEIVPCTFVLAVITQPGEALPAQIPESIADGVRPRAEVEVKTEDRPVESGGPPAQERRISISPSAKLLAKELGVDIARIIPSGERISRKDVEAAYEQMQAEAQKTPEILPAGPEAGNGTELRARRKPVTLLRRRIAERMGASAQTAARVGLKLEADASRLIAWRERLKSEGLPVGYSELFARLAAAALREFPYMNARLAGEEIWEMEAVNVGIAVDVEGGLLVPVIHDIDRKSPAEINRELREKVERARQGKSLPSDLEGGTFTVTNLGPFEIEEFLPIINLPECAILAVGAIIRKPVVVEEQVEVRPRTCLTLAFDHRLVDGAPAARFLQRVKELVENPPGI